MQKRRLGQDGLEVSAIGFGCMGLNYHRGPPPDRKEMIALIHAAVERGVTFFDTAEVYGPLRTKSLSAKRSRPLREPLSSPPSLATTLAPAVRAPPIAGPSASVR
jgi:aryl-alcohol dehydrogenase-like predicted oxidoreductase